MTVAGPSCTPAVAGINPPSDTELRLLQRLVYRECGIYLGAEKYGLITARVCRRVKALGLRSYGAYYRIVKGDADERSRLLDCITTNETRFFREPHQFSFLESKIFPFWEERAASGAMCRRVRAWSAGCATGEEPFSLAMLLLDRFPSWSIDVVATDLSTRALSRAVDGLWPIGRSAEIPDRYLRRFMLKGTRSQEGRIRVSPELRGVVRFQRLNLFREDCAVGTLFDLVLCRNVLIYFSPDSRRLVTDRLASHLDPAGFLFLGHAETLSQREDFKSIAPSIYCRPTSPFHPSAASGRAASSEETAVAPTAGGTSR